MENIVIENLILIVKWSMGILFLVCLIMGLGDDDRGNQYRGPDGKGSFYEISNRKDN